MEELTEEDKNAAKEEGRHLMAEEEKRQRIEEIKEMHRTQEAERRRILNEQEEEACRKKQEEEDKHLGKTAAPWWNNLIESKVAAASVKEANQNALIAGPRNDGSMEGVYEYPPSRTMLASELARQPNPKRTRDIAPDEGKKPKAKPVLAAVVAVAAVGTPEASIQSPVAAAAVPPNQSENPFSGQVVAEQEGNYALYEGDMSIWEAGQKSQDNNDDDDDDDSSFESLITVDSEKDKNYNVESEPDDFDDEYL